TWRRARAVPSLIIACAVIAPAVVFGDGQRHRPEFFARVPVQRHTYFAIRSLDGPPLQRERPAAAYGDRAEAVRDGRLPNLARPLLRPGMQNFFRRRTIMIRPAKLGPIGGQNLGYTQEHEQERGLVLPCHND